MQIGIEHEMKQYSAYVRSLHQLLENILIGPAYPLEYEESILQNLDGAASNALRTTIELRKLRNFGVFFTDSNLAHRAVNNIASTINSTSKVVDIACGAGDLLIACAKHLPIANNLETTLELWGGILCGYDLFPEFIQTTKARLVLAAVQRGVNIPNNYVLNLDNLFPLIVVGDGLKNANILKTATHIVINPPYVKVKAPENCSWSSSKTNSAAIFLEHCVIHTNPGTRIVAILPDVLRSGTYFEKWRKYIAANTTEKSLELFGQFDKWTDVDVFIIDLEIDKTLNNSGEGRWKFDNKKNILRIQDYFAVYTGRVVEFRDPLEGQSFPYIKPKTLPEWTIVENSENFRKYTGPTFTAPFVVIRRTSRKGHKYRAVGTIIDIPGEVAVENHLLVLIPKSGSLNDCKDLLNTLKDQRTNNWLNERILCRHLTVKSVAEIPWWEVSNDNS